MKFFIDERKVEFNSRTYRFLLIFLAIILGISFILNMPKIGKIIIIACIGLCPVLWILDRLFSSVYNIIEFTESGYTIKDGFKKTTTSWDCVIGIREGKKLLRYRQHGYEKKIVLEVKIDEDEKTELIYFPYYSEIYDCAKRCFDEYNIGRTE